MEKSMIEHYHSRGSMPDRIYYQLNGKSAQENYIDQRKRITEFVQKEKDLTKLKK